MKKRDSPTRCCSSQASRLKRHASLSSNYSSRNKQKEQLSRNSMGAIRYEQACTINGCFISDGNGLTRQIMSIYLNGPTRVGRELAGTIGPAGHGPSTHTPHCP